MIRRSCWPLILLLALTASAGCQRLGGGVPKPQQEEEIRSELPEERSPPPPQTPDFQPGNLRPEEYAAEISALETVARTSTANDRERAEAFRRLALLYLAPHNPARNLALAAEALASYLKLQPAGPARQEGEFWLALVQDSLACERLLQQQGEKTREKDAQLAELGAEKQRQAQKFAALEAANAKLKADIEKLKFIDLSVEKKRKNFR